MESQEEAVDGVQTEGEVAVYIRLGDQGRWINKDSAHTRNRARSDLFSRSPSSRLRVPSLARLLLFMYYILTSH